MPTHEWAKWGTSRYDGVPYRRWDKGEILKITGLAIFYPMPGRSDCLYIPEGMEVTVKLIAKGSPYSPTAWEVSTELPVGDFYDLVKSVVSAANA